MGVVDRTKMAKYCVTEVSLIELITPNVFEQDMQILKCLNVSFKRLTSVTQYLAILVRSTTPILELQIKRYQAYFVTHTTIILQYIPNTFVHKTLLNVYRLHHKAN
jgi:hypothetical protein